MDGRGGGFPGGPPPGGNINHRGGAGLPDMFNNQNLRGIDPQYAAALDFEELRIRHQLEVQQDMELRRRLVEEQQNQLISELEYRNKIQQLHDLQELQAHQQQQQQQQQGLSQLLAANPHLMDLQQPPSRQQYHSGNDNSSILSSLRDDFLLQQQRQTQLALQDQVQQQLREQLLQDSRRQHEQEELLAILRASGNLRGVSLPTPETVASLRQDEAIARQMSHEQAVVDSKPPATDAVTQLERLVNGASGQGTEYSPTADQEQTYARQAEEEASATKKRSASEATDDSLGQGIPQDPPVLSAKKSKSKDSPQRKSTSSKGAATKGKASSKAKKGTDKEQPKLDKETSPKLSSSTAATKPKKDGEATEKKRRKRKSKGGGEEPTPPPTKKGRKKKAATTATAASPVRKAAVGGSKTDSSNAKGLSDHEQSVIDFLGSRGSKNGTKKGPSDGSTGSTAAGKKKKKKGTVLAEAKARDDDEAADIMLHFKRVDVSSREVQTAEKWGRQNQTRVTTYPVVSPDEVPYISPGFKFNLPSLPIEPELTDFELSSPGPSVINATDGGTEEAKDDSSSAAAEPTVVHEVRANVPQRRIVKPKKLWKGLDEWWPSNGTVRKERRKRGARQDEEDTDDEDADAPSVGMSFVKAGVEAAKERLTSSVEPGVLEKLPHCRLYDEFCQKKKGGSGDHPPKFCCQTTETLPFEAMVCCSVCSTWRHAQCGGHYQRYTPDNVDPSNVLFKPLCDQCHLEQKFVESRPVATARLERQRIEHLRRANAANAVMRQVAFGKHSGQYKWPLGSVSISHISGHTRSVQARHEKAEKQWSEMASRLSSENAMKPRERQRVRTRELERLMVSVEDAAGAMDRHNMMLFLQNDTSKPQPAGFEVPRRNIFDPEEDPVHLPIETEPAKPLDTLENGILNSKAPDVADTNKSTDTTSLPGMKGLAATSTDGATNAPTNGKDKDGESKAKKGELCTRPGCTQKPRFDSMFCSDACGVSTLEKDLLRTLQYANRLHPCMLRS